MTLTYLTAKKTLDFYFKKNQWVLQRSANITNSDQYEDEMLTWHDTEVPKPSIDDLEVLSSKLEVDIVKQDLIEEISVFFDVIARIMLIRNGYQQPILCTQSFVDNLESALMQAKLDGLYVHILTDNNGKAIIDTDHLAEVKISIDALQKIKYLVEQRRGYCFKAKLYHSTMIDLLDNIGDVLEYKEKNSTIYNNTIIWTGNNGDEYILPHTIRVSSIDGNITNEEELGTINLDLSD